MNDKGNYMPAWGTCLGFQYLATYAATSGLEVLSENAFDSNDDNYPLKFLVPANETKMFEDLGSLNFLLANFNLTYNHHHDGVTPDKFESDKGLKSIFKPTSVSYDNKGKVFVASMEGHTYPFYGVQFHPEKQLFVFYPDTKIDHSRRSNEMNRYFGDFFVGESRFNHNKFSTYEEEVAHQTEILGDLIVLPTYTGLVYAFK